MKTVEYLLIVFHIGKLKHVFGRILPLLRRLMDILACPVCGRSFKLTVYRQEKIKREMSQHPGCRRYCGFVSQNIVSDAEKIFTNCPKCYQEEIVTGTLICENNHLFQIDNSIPRLQNRKVNQERTKQTFDVEWKVFEYKKKYMAILKKRN